MTGQSHAETRTTDAGSAVRMRQPGQAVRYRKRRKRLHLQDLLCKDLFKKTATVKSLFPNFSFLTYYFVCIERSNKVPKKGPFNSKILPNLFPFEKITIADSFLVSKHSVTPKSIAFHKNRERPL